MSGWQPWRFSWSFAAKRRFDDCRRAYFYHRFWGQDPRTRDTLKVMRDLRTLPMTCGIAVHQAIAEALAERKHGRSIDADWLEERVKTAFKERYMRSRRAWYVKDGNRYASMQPADRGILFEHYYDVAEIEEIDERAREYLDKAQQSVTNLRESPFWSELMSADTTRWRYIETSNDVPKCEIEGVLVYLRLDFAYIGESPTIIDWKTGRPSDVHRQQISLYALYAEKVWKWNPLETRLILAYLYPEVLFDARMLIQSDLDSFKRTLRDSALQMLALEPPSAPADISHFAPTSDPRRCGWCNFRGICDSAAAVTPIEPLEDADWE